MSGFKIAFKPVIPKEWEEYRFRIKRKGTLLEVTVSKQEARFKIIEGDRINFWIGEKNITLKGEGDQYVGKNIKLYFLTGMERL